MVGRRLFQLQDTGRQAVGGQARDRKKEREGKDSARFSSPRHPYQPGWVQAPLSQASALTTFPDPKPLVLLFFLLGMLSLPHLFL